MKILKNGALVLYRGKAAVVTDVTGDKFNIRIAGGDGKSVRRKDLEFLHPGPCTTAAPAAPPAPPEASAQAEIAELMGAEPMEFAEFAELVFGKYTPEAAFGAQALLSENCYFTGSPESGVKANPADHVAAIQNREAQKLLQQQARTALLERIRSGRVAPGDTPALREIENVAYGESVSSKLLHELGIEALPNKAQALLLKLGTWNEFDFNPWPRRFGVTLNPEYPAWPDALPDEPRVDLTAMAAYAIDDTDSSDPDDAISFDPASGLVWVHIADPGAAVGFGSPLEEAAADTGESLYLPEKIVPMLPPAAVPMLGLGLQDVSPALSFGVRISEAGDATLEKLVLSQVRVERLDYAGAEARLEAEPFKALTGELERFRKRRQEHNAVMIRLPEVKIKVDIPAREIRIEPLTQNRVRETVANAMLAAGAAAAKFAVEHDFALPFAIQPEPEMAERPETLPGMYELRKSCRQSTLATLPGRHAGLGLEPYVRVTSPLRRYEDLLAHLQLRRFLKGEPLLSGSELDERIARSEPAAATRGKLERQCNEYWILTYLATHPDWEGEAVLAAKPDERSAWLIPELAYEFKNRYGGRTKLGEVVRVRALGADPAALAAQFRVLPTA